MMPESNSVSIVIPNWNGRHWLPGCLAALGRQSVPPAETIVVDNGSEDGSLDYLREEHPQVRVIALGVNTGFAHAVNVGLRAASSEYVALINTDIELTDDWIERMRAALEADPQLASVACKMLLLADPSVVYDAGDVLRRDGLCEQRGRHGADDGSFDTPGRGVRRVRRSRALPAPGGARPRRLRRALLRLPGGRGPGAAAALAGWTLPLRARRGAACRAGLLGAGCREATCAWSSATRCCWWRRRSRFAGCRSFSTASSAGLGMPCASAGSDGTCAGRWRRCRCSPARCASAAAYAAMPRVPIEVIVPSRPHPRAASRGSSDSDRREPRRPPALICARRTGARIDGAGRSTQRETPPGGAGAAELCRLRPAGRDRGRLGLACLSRPRLI